MAGKSQTDRALDVFNRAFQHRRGFILYHKNMYERPVALLLFLFLCFSILTRHLCSAINSDVSLSVAHREKSLQKLKTLWVGHRTEALVFDDLGTVGVPFASV